MATWLLEATKMASNWTREEDEKGLGDH